jgi:hypothetical protein
MDALPMLIEEQERQVARRAREASGHAGAAPAAPPPPAAGHSVVDWHCDQPPPHLPHALASVHDAELGLEAALRGDAGAAVTATIAGVAHAVAGRLASPGGSSGGHVGLPPELDELHAHPAPHHEAAAHAAPHAAVPHVPAPHTLAPATLATHVVAPHAPAQPTPTHTDVLPHRHPDELW